MNTANKLTVLRVLLIPVFLVLLYVNLILAGLIVFCIAALTDFADGIIARRRNQVTDFGKFMDPLADKVLTVAAMLWFIEVELMPAWLVLIVIVREFMVTGIRLVGAAKGTVIAASMLGKIKTVATLNSIVAIFLLYLIIPGLQWPLYICWALIGLTTVISGAEYFAKNRELMKMGK